MMHPYLFLDIAKQHQDNLLKEAEAYRRACQMENEQRVQASLLKRMVSGLGGLLPRSWGQFAWDAGAAANKEN